MSHTLETQEVIDNVQGQKNDVFDCAVSGIIYDFMGWLTSRSNKIILSKNDDAVPAVDAIHEFLTLRNISTESDAMIHDWPLMRGIFKIDAPCNLPR